MQRRRPRPRIAAAPALVLAAWTTACYTTQSYQPSAAAGTASSSPAAAAAGAARRDRVQVEFPRPTRLHVQSAEGDTGSTEAKRVTGTVVEVRGDTVVLRAPTEHGTRLSFTPRGRAAVNAATVLITPGEEGRLTTQHFSVRRTTLLGLGAAAVVGTVAIANNSASGRKGGTSKIPTASVAR